MTLSSSFLSILVVFFLAASSLSFSPTPQSTISSTQAGMGMFDFIQDAFGNEKYEDRRASASHILVDSNDEALIVQKEIAGGKSFADAAREYSTCPSSSKGGSLGTFEPGTMVKDFDDVVFNNENEVGKVLGPVSTQFGYHLIMVEDRFENQDRTEGSGVF
mmetsp:Transcript_10949/g.16131  ORF Transcript_10949/g.16131 Transcript_10949/m.16131 type:complete len:161 (+) Transcript_10949:162-644(+)|eukprot:CAMPEP_0194212082 /NCGR_PEP_ID=MMETSP0156-20130528/11711_1 /TAXON_ID=33649 /ORGANISM="Thalassionema nitzschioides, Strain L26-B" /LENGTH=160 /DNA_ID=CAMNT_0038939817 /DNA_START=96 /DNA_END=578 /DNA_ORIENTATION=-